MIFLGSFLCGDTMSVPCTPTCVDNIIAIELKNGEYDDLYISKDTDLNIIDKPPENWNFNTIAYAKFDGNTLAGNIDWSIETVSNILIKRRRVNEFKWITLSVNQVNSFVDFNVAGADITTPSNSDYEFAAVPVLNGIEGNYSSTIVNCKSDSLIIADADEIWATGFTDAFCDTVTTAPIGKIEPLYNKYPTIIKNGNACYDDINFTVSFFQLKLLNEETGYKDFVVEDGSHIDYHLKAKNFINNGKVKLIKNKDGRMWLGYVTAPTTDKADGHYQNRQLNFTLTEVGNPKSEEDLFNAGFITSTSEWWNT